MPWCVAKDIYVHLFYLYSEESVELLKGVWSVYSYSVEYRKRIFFFQAPRTYRDNMAMEHTVKRIVCGWRPPIFARAFTAKQ